MAKNQNTFAKRKRERDKKLRAEEKLAERKKRKTEKEENPTGVPVVEQEMFDDLL